jgi:hypothetical protein
MTPEVTYRELDVVRIFDAPGSSRRLPAHDA